MGPQSAPALRWAIALSAGALVACTHSVPCGPDTCDGCCGTDGRCYVGAAIAACGQLGAQCQACSTGNQCLAGACVPPSPCMTATDCAAINCVCGDGAAVSSRRCTMGRCGADCDADCVAAGHPKLGESPDAGRQYSMCVDGTAGSCTSSDADWLGGKCCVVTGYGQCVGGTAAGCTGPNLLWTGATCCVKSSFGPCAPGTDLACSGADLAWTGLTCCVSDAYLLCADGLGSSCAVDGLLWTGSKCCALAEYTVCTDGTGQACQGNDMRWTGTLCCVKGKSTCSAGTQAACTGDWTGTKCCL
jgi:hypothetical protein